MNTCYVYKMSTSYVYINEHVMSINEQVTSSNEVILQVVL